MKKTKLFLTLLFSITSFISAKNPTEFELEIKTCYEELRNVAPHEMSIFHDYLINLLLEDIQGKWEIINIDDRPNTVPFNKSDGTGWTDYEYQQVCDNIHNLIH